MYESSLCSKTGNDMCFYVSLSYWTGLHDDLIFFVMPAPSMMPNTWPPSKSFVNLFIEMNSVLSSVLL